FAGCHRNYSLEAACGLPTASLQGAFQHKAAAGQSRRAQPPSGAAKRQDAETPSRKQTGTGFTQGHNDSETKSEPQMNADEHRSSREEGVSDPGDSPGARDLRLKSMAGGCAALPLPICVDPCSSVVLFLRCSS